MPVAEEHLRTALLLGEKALGRLAAARVAVFGVGGVGGHVCEALARAGVGEIDLYDSDRVSPSNLNRQLVALQSTLGEYKVEVMKKRILDINPACQVNTHTVFYLPENAEQFPLEGYSYIVDAVDTVAAKIELAVRASACGLPIISAMGAGNKLDPTRFAVTDLSKTSGCPLARVMRRELKARGIHHLKVVYSTEPAAPLHTELLAEASSSRPPVGSLSFVPSVAGLILAGEVVKDLTAGAE